jgi:hypothetical protein
MKIYGNVRSHIKNGKVLLLFFMARVKGNNLKGKCSWEKSKKDPNKFTGLVLLLIVNEFSLFGS